MIDGPTPRSIEDLFTSSDVVAEVSVLRLYEEVGSELEDERIVKHMLDVRVDVPYKGAAEGDTLAVYAAMEISNPQRPDQGSGLTGEANLVPEGSTALMNLSEGAAGELEGTGLYGSVLLIDGDDVSMPGRPTCQVGQSEPPENQLRDTIERITTSDLRQALTTLAAAES